MKKFKFSISFFMLIAICILTQKFLLLINYFCALALHELAHIFVALKRGYKVKYVKLSMLGLSVELDNQIDSKDAFAINIAGPACNLILCVLCLASYSIFPASFAMLNTFCVCNLVLAFFNLLPIYPLDGGKIFQSIFKTKKAYLIADLIVRLLLTITFAIMFICSIFAETNWLYLLFAVFFILQTPKHSPNFSLFKSKTNHKYEKVVMLKIDESQNLFSLLKLINNKNYTIFYCPTTHQKYIDEDSVVNFALKFPLDTSIKNII